MSRPSMHQCARAALALVLGFVALALPAPALPAGPPAPSACPHTLSEVATCYSGEDDNGAHYAIAIPHDWNGSLVVHAHGGPDLSEGSDPARSPEDLER